MLNIVYDFVGFFQMEKLKWIAYAIICSKKSGNFDSQVTKWFKIAKSLMMMFVYNFDTCNRYKFMQKRVSVSTQNKTDWR